MDKINMIMSMLLNPENYIIDNINIERQMQNELAQLAQEWKKRGWIKKFIIGPDKSIADKYYDKSEGESDE